MGDARFLPRLVEDIDWMFRRRASWRGNPPPISSGAISGWHVFPIKAHSDWGDLSEGPERLLLGQYYCVASGIHRWFVAIIEIPEITSRRTSPFEVIELPNQQAVAVAIINVLAALGTEPVSEVAQQLLSSHLGVHRGEDEGAVAGWRIIELPFQVGACQSQHYSFMQEKTLRVGYCQGQYYFLTSGTHRWFVALAQLEPATLPPTKLSASDEPELDSSGAPRRRTRLTNEVMSEVWTRDEGNCVLCGSCEELQFDHIIPHSLGGASTAENLRILCSTCNSKRGAPI